MYRSCFANSVPEFDNLVIHACLKGVDRLNLQFSILAWYVYITDTKLDHQFV
jgi:predicted protein tyrosine phosphatase